ncbi:MAG: serine hydrolase [Candidatus Kerfeldbacteria bacterium]|nr:serine hydrolase [Candidatus Kerfeldbacteria bacterium]
MALGLEMAAGHVQTPSAFYVAGRSTTAGPAYSEQGELLCGELLSPSFLVKPPPPRLYSAVTTLPIVKLLLVCSIVFAFNVARVAPAEAQSESWSVRFSEQTLERGYTLHTDQNDVRVIIKPQTFTVPGIVRLTRNDASLFPEWKGYERISDIFTVTVEGADGMILAQPLGIEFAVSETGFVSRIAKFDQATQLWHELGSATAPDGTRVRAADDKLEFTIAAWRKPGVQEGIASYYGTYTRQTNLTMVAASNHFPKGQLLRVTNLDNGKTVTVKVVDSGAFRLPRVIDLSTPAFARIQPTWKGVARVVVVKATPWNKPPDEPTDPDVIQGGPVSDGAIPPTTPATASIVVDAATGKKLLGKKTSVSLPIASLTKLVTAAVFMDTKPDLNRVVAYDPADNAECSCLRLAPGEEVTLKDLLFASLVGSANNATLALARVTGVDRPEFVNRMNAKAQELGLKQTSFVEPTGLDSGNVSTAEDLAVIGRLVPESNSTLRRVLTTGSYRFTSKNNLCHEAYRQSDATCVHSFQTTNKLFGKTSFTITAAKTGFINESRHTFLLRGKNKDGRELIVVLLKVYRKPDIFSSAERLMNWSFEHYRWT